MDFLCAWHAMHMALRQLVLRRCALVPQCVCIWHDISTLKICKTRCVCITRWVLWVVFPRCSWHVEAEPLRGNFKGRCWFTNEYGRIWINTNNLLAIGKMSVKNNLNVRVCREEVLSLRKNSTISAGFPFLCSQLFPSYFRQQRRCWKKKSSLFSKGAKIQTFEKIRTSFTRVGPSIWRFLIKLKWQKFYVQNGDVFPTQKFVKLRQLNVDHAKVNDDKFEWLLRPVTWWMNWSASTLMENISFILGWTINAQYCSLLSQ